MKQLVLDFVRRGLVTCGFGPLTLVVIYIFIDCQWDVQMLEVSEVCLGILSLSILAFIAGGMNVIYQIEQLPLMVAILIHGIVLYIFYLITYMINGWLKQGVTPFLIFSAFFVLGYLSVWAVIYLITKKRTEKLNEKLKKANTDRR